MDSLDLIKELEIFRRLTPLEKLLAVTNGSVTQTLEVLLGEPIRIRTISQEVKEASRLASQLDVKKTDLVNFRKVEITDQEGRVLVIANSWTPISRLKPGFKDDLMKADVPIGKLLIKHKIESRRELLDASIKGGRLTRTYNIINDDEVLMRIEETFTDEVSRLSWMK